MIYLIKLFLVKPKPFAKIRLNFNGQIIQNKTEYDGFFKFEFKATDEVAAGWHLVTVETLGENDEVISSGEGKIFVPHKTQYAFISDIDDTVMVSYSAKIYKRLRQLFIKNPRTRKTFPAAKEHYQLLANSHTTIDQPNPFFYVSSSEWNLYDYLVETFRFNGLPEGSFLLNQLKTWKGLFKTGKTGHKGKLIRVIRLLDAFPEQQFVFFGDNSQQDPIIYQTITEKYPSNIKAVYIRNVRPSRTEVTETILASIAKKNIATCLFNHSSEAIIHSKKIGLII